MYFAAHRFFGAAGGLLEPFLVLGLPCAGLSAAGHFLYRKEHKAVAVAFVLGAVLLLPLLLLILFHEARHGPASEVVPAFVEEVLSVVELK